MSYTFPIFAVPIYTSSVITDDNFKKELNFIETLDFKKTASNWVSINTKVINAPEMSRCKEIFEYHLNAYVNTTFCCDQEFFITNSWIARTKPGEEHHKHLHPNSIISGVLYLKVEKEPSSISFHKEPATKGDIGLLYDVKDFNIYNSDSWSIPVSQSQIVIFPSSLQHSVNTNDTENERIVLGFNTFVKGSFGKGAYCADLVLNEF
jgi:hypothetical protein